MYQRLQLQFYVLLMMGAMDPRNMYSNLAVNKYLHTVASFGLLQCTVVQFNGLFLASCAQFMVGALNLRFAFQVWPA